MRGKTTYKKEMKKINRRKRKQAAVGAAAGTAAAAVAVTAAAYQLTFGRTKLGYKLSLGTRSSEFNDMRAQGAHKLSNMQCEEYTIESARGTKLKGYYYHCSDKPTGKIAFIVHGRHTDHLESAGLYYEYYHEKGFDVFTCDNAGAGKSGGNLTGYDMFESRDCLLWTDFLYERFGEDIQVILHGFSMGASAILKFSDYCPECVKFIVSDSAYTEAGSLIKAKTKLLYEPLRIMNRIFGGYDLTDTQVISHVADCDVPILFVHGENDEVVPFEMAEELYECCASEKDSLFVKDAGHVEAMFKAPRAYTKKLDEFIEKYIIDYKW